MRSDRSVVPFGRSVGRFDRFQYHNTYICLGLCLCGSSFVRSFVGIVFVYDWPFAFGFVQEASVLWRTRIQCAHRSVKFYECLRSPSFIQNEFRNHSRLRAVSLIQCFKASRRTSGSRTSKGSKSGFENARITLEGECLSVNLKLPFQSYRMPGHTQMSMSMSQTLRIVYLPVRWNIQRARQSAAGRPMADGQTGS